MKITVKQLLVILVITMAMGVVKANALTIIDYDTNGDYGSLVAGGSTVMNGFDGSHGRVDMAVYQDAGIYTYVMALSNASADVSLFHVSGFSNLVTVPENSTAGTDNMPGTYNVNYIVRGDFLQYEADIHNGYNFTNASIDPDATFFFQISDTPLLTNNAYSFSMINGVTSTGSLTLATPVPEPETITLFTIGCFVLGCVNLFRRRRKRGNHFTVGHNPLEISPQT